MGPGQRSEGRSDGAASNPAEPAGRPVVIKVLPPRKSTRVTDETVAKLERNGSYGDVVELAREIAEGKR